MRLFNDIRNYIGENNFRIIIYDNKIDVVNYTRIDEITNNKVIISSNRKITITGKNLKVSKLEHEEVLVLGEITNINFDE